MTGLRARRRAGKRRTRSRGVPRGVEERVRRIYGRLAKRAGVYPAPRLEFKRYRQAIARFIATRKRGISDVKIRVDPDLAAKLSNRELEHVLAHELVHYILYTEGADEFTQRLHLTRFYKVLARIMGYSDVKEAEKKDYEVRVKAEGVVEEAQKEREKEERKEGNSQNPYFREGKLVGLDSFSNTKTGRGSMYMIRVFCNLDAARELFERLRRLDGVSGTLTTHARDPRILIISGVYESRRGIRKHIVRTVEDVASRHNVFIEFGVFRGVHGFKTEYEAGDLFKACYR